MTPRPLPDRRSMGLPLQRLKGWVCIWRTAVGTTGPCSVRLADLCRGDEVSRWWWALAGRAGAAGDVAVAGGAAVRRGRGAGGGGDPAAGEHEVGLSVAAALACRRRGGAGFDGPGRGQLPAVRRPASTAARGAGARAGRARLGRSALDPGADRDGDRPAVPPPLHPARHRVSAAPHGLVAAGPPAPRGRARRGRDRRVAHPDLGEGTRLAASTGAWIVFEDEAGATLRPPKARTWAARGHTPVVAVSGKGGRVSMAALVCYRPGCRGRLFYRIGVHRRRRGERRSFSEDAYAGLIAAAHVQLHAPIILIWDNLNVHLSAVMRAFCEAHSDWLTVFSCRPTPASSTPPRACGRTSSVTWATCLPAPSTSSPPAPRGCSSASSTAPNSSTDSSSASSTAPNSSTDSAPRPA